MNIFYIETSQIQSVRCLTFALATLLSDYSGTNSALSFSIGSQAVRRQLSGETLRILEFQRLHFVVLEAVACAYVTALLDIQFIRRLVPYVAHIVDAEMVLDAFFGNQNVAFGSGLGNNGKTYTCLFHQLFECFLVFHLDQDTRIFGEQNLDNVLFRQFVEVHFQTAFHIGKTHFKQCCDHTTG